MVLKSRKKNTRARGSWTHGGGAKKKRRGAGHRGGRGNAGSGKRGDAKKPSYWQGSKYLGRRGFEKHGIKMIMNPINISVLDCEINKLIIQKKYKEGDKIELLKLGYNKLLGAGNTTKKLNIVTPQASKKAIEKIAKAGGSVTVE